MTLFKYFKKTRLMHTKTRSFHVGVVVKKQHPAISLIPKSLSIAQTNVTLSIIDGSEENERVDSLVLISPEQSKLDKVWEQQGHVNWFHSFS